MPLLSYCDHKMVVIFNTFTLLLWPRNIALLTRWPPCNQALPGPGVDDGGDEEDGDIMVTIYFEGRLKF